jgi:hypothetical protein
MTNRELVLYLAMSEFVAEVSLKDGTWTVDLQLVGCQPQCLARDSHRPQRLYCGTLDQGLWRSDNAGESWEQVGAGIESPSVTSVTVSLTERVGGYGVVYAGTEPTRLYRSEDGGNTWQALNTLHQVPSASTWGLPDRPGTSRVRWITSDPLVGGRLFVAIEAGALLRSLDGGQTWEDRTPSSPYDTHTLVMHPLAPNRLYAAAGDGFILPGNGFAESEDGGQTWQRLDEGLEHHYLWSVAADPTDPTTLVISAAHGPDQAHTLPKADSVLYRRSGHGPWQQVQDGFPEPHGLSISVLATHEVEPGVFYAANNQGVFRSSNAGSGWETLPIPWPQNYHNGHTNALLVMPC